MLGPNTNICHMSLQQTLSEDLNTAMKTKNRVRMQVIRQIKATVKNKEIEVGEILDDDGVHKVIATLIRQHHESIEEFKDGDRDDLVEKEEQELEILLSYLPEQLTDEELLGFVRQCINIENATSLKDIPQVMKSIMPKVTGIASGDRVIKIVRKELQGV